MLPNEARLRIRGECFLNLFIYFMSIVEDPSNSHPIYLKIEISSLPTINKTGVHWSHPPNMKMMLTAGNNQVRRQPPDRCPRSGRRLQRRFSGLLRIPKVLRRRSENNTFFTAYLQVPLFCIDLSNGFSGSHLTPARPLLLPPYFTTNRVAAVGTYQAAPQ